MEGSHVTGLIDATAARCDTIAIDLARLLGSLLLPTGAWDPAIQTYRRVRPITEETVSLARLLDHAGILTAGLHWLDPKNWGTSGVPLFNDQPSAAILNRLDWIEARLAEMHSAANSAEWL